jgi:Secretion system C-terminal sorting domain
MGVIMKMRLLVFILIAIGICGFLSVADAQKVITIPQLQYTSRDSLLKLDTLQNAANAIRLDKSSYWHGSGTAYNDDSKNDTVQIKGVVIVAPRVLTYTLARFNIYIQDSAGHVFGGLNVLTDDTSATAQGTGITALDTGDVVTVTGKLKEYSASGQNNSLTEILCYSKGFYEKVTPVNVSSSWNNTGVRPAPIQFVGCDSFATGQKPKPSSGEQYEGMYVSISNVTVTAVDAGYGAFTFMDAKGNMMKMYDGSQWYTYRSHKNANSTFTTPPVGTVLKYIRGVIVCQARTGTCGDYCVMPLYPGPNELKGSKYPGDIAIDKYGPAITSLRRLPSPPKPTDIVNITYKSYNPANTYQKADSTFFRYRVGTQTNVRSILPWQRVRIDSTAGDTVYHTTIPAQAEGSLVSYFVESYLANVYSSYPDSSIPSFYVVRAAGPTIYDVCYSPFANAASGFAYDTVTVSGVIVADTTDVQDITSRGGRANAPLLWLQAGTSTYHGIQIWGPQGKIVDTLKRGDSVSVRGSVYGTSNRISIAVTSIPYFSRSSSVVIPTSKIQQVASSPYFDYDVLNPIATTITGTSTASAFQPYMSMLNEVDNWYIVLSNADNTLNTAVNNYGEFFISNSITPNSIGSFYGVRVDDNGMNHYYCDTNAQYVSGWTYSFNTVHPFAAGIKGNKAYLIPLYAKISYIRGILDYTNGTYKLEPRKDDDYGTIVTEVFKEQNTLPTGFKLEQNYPNPFNPMTTIRYLVPIASKVTLRVYNILGQEVESLFDGQAGAGAYVVQFDASRLATGVYFYELRAGDYRDIKKMVLLK